MATLEAGVTPGTELQTTRRAIKAKLADRFGMEHATADVDEIGAEVKPADLAAPASGESP